MTITKTILVDESQEGGLEWVGNAECTIMDALGYTENKAVSLVFDPSVPTLNKGMMLQLAAVLLAKATEMDATNEINFTDGSEHRVDLETSTYFDVMKSSSNLFTVKSQQWKFNRATFLSWALGMLRVYASIAKFTNKDSK